MTKLFLSCLAVSFLCHNVAAKNAAVGSSITSMFDHAEDVSFNDFEIRQERFLKKQPRKKNNYLHTCDLDVDISCMVESDDFPAGPVGCDFPEYYGSCFEDAIVTTKTCISSGEDMAVSQEKLYELLSYTFASEVKPMKKSKGTKKNKLRVGHPISGIRWNKESLDIDLLPVMWNLEDSKVCASFTRGNINTCTSALKFHVKMLLPISNQDFGKEYSSCGELRVHGSYVVVPKENLLYMIPFVTPIENDVGVGILTTKCTPNYRSAITGGTSFLWGLIAVIATGGITTGFAIFATIVAVSAGLVDTISGSIDCAEEPAGLDQQNNAVERAIAKFEKISSESASQQFKYLRAYMLAIEEQIPNVTLVTYPDNSLAEIQYRILLISAETLKSRVLSAHIYGQAELINWSINLVQLSRIQPDDLACDFAAVRARQGLVRNVDWFLESYRTFKQQGRDQRTCRCQCTNIQCWPSSNKREFTNCSSTLQLPGIWTTGGTICRPRGKCSPTSCPAEGNDGNLSAEDSFDQYKWAGLVIDWWNGKGTPEDEDYVVGAVFYYNTFKSLLDVVTIDSLKKLCGTAGQGMDEPPPEVDVPVVDCGFHSRPSCYECPRFDNGKFTMAFFLCDGDCTWSTQAEDRPRECVLKS